MFDGGEDRCLVFGDASLQVDERGDPATSCPADPGLEGFDGLLIGQMEDQPESFLEEVGPVEPGVGLGDQASLACWRLVRFSGFFHNA